MNDLHDIPFTPEITASTEAYQGAVWSIRRETFDLPEATGLVRDLMVHTGAVAVACLNEDNEILLVQQYRHPVRARLWEVPAGLLDIPGEDPLTAAQRELAEEADLRAGSWRVLSDSVLSPGGSSETMRLYLARDLTPVPTADRHERSDEEAGFVYRWVDLDEALAAIADGRLTNSVAQLAILQVADVVRREAAGENAHTRPIGAPRLLVDGRDAPPAGSISAPPSDAAASGAPPSAES
ncbi:MULTISPECIES: NUDIX hydrolase [Brevibacterium]|uniref:NUDIX hydrolase n=1 Tax=Brevibacterium casei TaxID=33889 RepID=A0A7T4DIK5_9MICO|nr:MULTISPECIES: NUDIX hydrolase [Brevibacterium]QQB13883.1 NUDIX hydrolase [Brevibacterium casei]